MWLHTIYGFNTPFFGMAGSHKDINILQRYPVFSKLAEDNSLKVYYEINGHMYDKRYYLASIYPSWSTLVKAIVTP
jgi:hypothetical protein